jgi:hypothetical protein
VEEVGGHWGYGNWLWLRKFGLHLLLSGHIIVIVAVMMIAATLIGHVQLLDRLVLRLLILLL